MDATLPTEAQKPSYDVSRLRIFLHGPPKIGKSLFAAGWPGALMLATERGLEYMTRHEKKIESWEHLSSVIDVIEKGAHQYKTIVIDTMDIAVSMCRDAVCGKAGVEYENDGELGYGKGTSMIAAGVERFLRRLARLPYGIILTSHTEQKVVKRKGGVDIQKAQPTVPDKVRRILLGWVDMILYMDQDEEVGTDGKLREVRVLRTATSPYYEAGDRTHCLPETVKIPMVGGYEAFVAALKGDTNTKEKE